MNTKFLRIGAGFPAKALLIFVAACPFSALAAPKQITKCQNITEPGTYVLANNLEKETPASIFEGCLNIRSISNVTIDCNHHSITGSIGIYLKNVANFSLENCVLKGETNLLSIIESSRISIHQNSFFPSTSTNKDSPSIFFKDSSAIDIRNNSIVAVLSLVGSNESKIEDNVIMSPIAFTTESGAKILPTNVNINGGRNHEFRGNFLDGRAKVIEKDFLASMAFGGADDGLVLINVSDSVIENNKFSNFWDLAIEGIGTWSNNSLLGNRTDGASVGPIGGWYKDFGDKSHYGFAMAGCKFENNVSTRVGNLFVFSPLPENGFEVLHIDSDAFAKTAFSNNHFSGNRILGAMESCQVANGTGDSVEGRCHLTYCDSGFIKQGEKCLKIRNENEEAITKLYQSILHREPDAAGLAYWVGAVKSGTATLKTVERNFQIVASVDAFYRQILGREPDVEGKNYWVGKISNGEHSLEEVRKHFNWCHSLPKSDASYCE